MNRIGIIGLGNMGAPMAKNLIEAGYKITGFDVVRENIVALSELGLCQATSVAEVSKDAEIIICMLPTGEHVRQVMNKPGGVFDSAPTESLIIDCSTIDVNTAREMAVLAGRRRLDFIDAPVSGGIMGAKSGTLTFMCGGTDEAFKRAQPILSAMGQNIVHAGGAGNGQAAKVCNNMLLGISMIGVAEAFNLADALGLERQKLFEIASTASGQCWSLNTYCPVPGPVPTSPANSDYRPGFSVAMMLKDLKLSQDAANAGKTSTPLGRAATELYEQFDEAGNSGLDFSGIIRFLRQQ